MTDDRWAIKSECDATPGALLYVVHTADSTWKLTLMHSSLTSNYIALSNRQMATMIDRIYTKLNPHDSIAPYFAFLLNDLPNNTFLRGLTAQELIDYGSAIIDLGLERNGG